MIRCSRLTAPKNGRLIYANEHGRVADNQTNYPMGTFIEIQCENQTVVKGDGFLSCIDSGTWDLPMAECVPTPMTTMATSSESTTTTEQPNTSATLHFDTIPSIVSTTQSRHEESTTKPTPFKVKSLPDKRFWADLKQLYYYGCSNAEVKPVLCSILEHPANYTELTLFELPDTNEFKHMDQNLLSHLITADDILNAHPRLELTIETLFPFILYANDNPNEKQLPTTMENAYRFVLCLYIDTILFDKNLNITFVQDPIANEDNITQKLKYFIVRIASKVYDQYTQADLRITQVDVETTTPLIENITEILQVETERKITAFERLVSLPNATIPQDVPKTTPIFEQTTQATVKKGIDLVLESETVEETCQLEALPDTPSSSFINEITFENETLFKMPDRLYLIGPVSVHTRAHTLCKEGFKPKSNAIHYFECDENLKWSGSSVACDGTYEGESIIIILLLLSSHVTWPMSIQTLYDIQPEVLTPFSLQQ